MSFIELLIPGKPTRIIRVDAISSVVFAEADNHTVVIVAGWSKPFVIQGDNARYAYDQLKAVLDPTPVSCDPAVVSAVNLDLIGRGLPSAQPATE
jgi:hypothetical protein